MKMKLRIGEYERRYTKRHGTVRPRRLLLHRERVDWRDVTESQFKKALAAVKRTYARCPISARA